MLQEQEQEVVLHKPELQSIGPYMFSWPGSWPQRVEHDNTTPFPLQPFPATVHYHPGLPQPLPLLIHSIATNDEKDWCAVFGHLGPWSAPATRAPN